MAVKVGELVEYLRVDDSDFRRGLNRAERQTATSATRMSRHLDLVKGSLTKLLGLALKAGVFTVLASGMALVTVRSVQLLASIAPVLHVLWLLPAAVLAAVATFATFKIALSGVGDAISAGLSGDLDKFAEALTKLAPSAAEFAKVIVALKPALDDLKRSVQEQFFAGLAAQMQTLADRALPILHGRLTDIASALNGAAGYVLDWAGSWSALADLDHFLSNVALSVRILGPAVAAVAAAFLGLSTAGSDFLPGLSASIASAAEQFAAFIASARESGQLAEWIRTGLDVLGSLGSLLADLGGIIKAVFSAASASGANVLGVLGAGAEALRGFLESAEGQSALGSLFAGLQQIAGIIGDLMRGAGPGLSDLLGGLAAGLKALAPAAGPVGKALGAIMSAAAPLLPVLGTLLSGVLTVLAGVVQYVAAAMAPLIELWAQAAVQILPMLLGPLAQLAANVLPMAAQAGVQVAQAFAPLIPVVLRLAQSFLDQLMPHLPRLQKMLVEALVPALAQVAQALAGGLMDALVRLEPHIPAIVDAGVLLAEVLVRIMVVTLPLLPLFAKLIGWIIGVSTAWMGLVGWMQKVPGMIADIFASAGRWLWNAGARIVQGLIDGIRSKFNEVKDTLSDLTSKLPSWKGPPMVDRSILAPSGRLLIRGLMTGVAAEVPRLRDQMFGITDMLGALGRGGAFTPAAAGMGPVTTGPVNVHVTIGDEALDSSMVRVIRRNPEEVATANAQGARSVARR